MLSKAILLLRRLPSGEEKPGQFSTVGQEITTPPKVTVKPLIHTDTYRCRNNWIGFSIINIFTGIASGVRTCKAETR